MIKRKVLMMAAAVLFAYAARLSGNPPPPVPVVPIFGKVNNADKCIGGTWHWIHIDKITFLWGLITITNENLTYDEDSKVPCCKEGEVVLMSLRPHDQAADVCYSTGLQGDSEPNANTAAPDPPPPLPYRTFGLPPLTFGPAPPPSLPFQCNPQGNPTAFHVIHLGDVVTRINLCNSRTIAAIQVPSNPLQVAVTPDAKTAIVTSYDNAITFINTATNTVAKVLQTDQNTFPSGISISPDGTFALVTSYIDDRPALLYVDVQQRAITRRVSLGRQYPQSVFLSPDGTLAWVTYPFANVVEVIDVMTGIVDFGLAVQEPIDVVFNNTGTTAYVSSRRPGSVAAVNTTTYAITKNIPTAEGASDLLLSPDGGLLTVNNLDNNSISIIDTTSLAVLSTTKVSGSPIGAVLVPIQ